MVDGQVQYILATASQLVGICTRSCLGEGLTINSISITVASGYIMCFTCYNQVEGIVNRTSISICSSYCNMSLTCICMTTPCIFFTFADYYIEYRIHCILAFAVFNYNSYIYDTIATIYTLQDDWFINHCLSKDYTTQFE